MKELFEIYDGSAEAKKAKGKSKNLSGFHPLFTASARRSIALDALKIWLLLGFIVGIVTGVATGAGAVSVLLGLLIAAVESNPARFRLRSPTGFFLPQTKDMVY